MRMSEPILPLFARLDHLIDDKVGVIRSVAEIPREAGAPEFFHYYADACNTRAFCGQANFNKTGGASTDRGCALAKAVGEAIERYCSAIYDPNEFLLTSYNDAPFPCVPPTEFALYSEEQHQDPDFPYVRFLNSTRVRWASSIDLATGCLSYVPAAMIYVPYSFTEEDGESPIAQRISTGLACHCSLAEAAVTAVCEVIERDAMTISWQAKLQMPQILKDTLSEENRDLVRRFERTGSLVTLLNLTFDHGVPTILAALRGQTPDSPALVVAASSHLDPERAVRKSLEELAHTHRMAQQITMNSLALAPMAGYANITTQDDHVHFYCNHANSYLAQFLFGSTERVNFSDMGRLATSDPQADLSILIKRVHAVGHRVLLTDLTTPDVSEVGLYVVRALIPGFHPLFLGHRVRALGGSRLWTIPQQLGYGGITRQEGANESPHPFP